MKEKCPSCDEEKNINENCDYCGYKLSTSRNIPPANDIVRHDFWIEKCPVCKLDKPYRFSKQVFFKLITKHYIECEACGSKFKQKSRTYYKLIEVLKKSNQVWKLYGGQTFSKKEWVRISEGGMSADVAYGVVEIGNEGFSLAGRTSSYGAGAEDIWFIITVFENETIDGFTYSIMIMALSTFILIRVRFSRFNKKNTTTQIQLEKY